MSEPLRIAVVAEGPTDSIVLEAVVRSLLAGAEFEFDTLQPAEDSIVFGANFRLHGPGWGGVYRWSRQAAEKGGGSLSGFSKLSQSQWDILIIHVDADVADKTYASANIQSPPQDDLPCAKPCATPSHNGCATNGSPPLVGGADLPTRNHPLYPIQNHGCLGADRCLSRQRQVSVRELRMPL